MNGICELISAGAAQIPIHVAVPACYHFAMPREFLAVDPRTLHLLPSSSGADPVKLHRQIAMHGTSTAGMPPLWVYRGTDGGLVIFDGVTRATRVAKWLPGSPVQVEVIGELNAAVGRFPTIGDKLP